MRADAIYATFFAANWHFAAEAQRLLRPRLRAFAAAPLLVARRRGAVLPRLAAPRRPRTRARRSHPPAPCRSGRARRRGRHPLPRLGRGADGLRPDGRRLLHAHPRLGILRSARPSRASRPGAARVRRPAGPRSSRAALSWVRAPPILLGACPLLSPAHRRVPIPPPSCDGRHGPRAPRRHRGTGRRLRRLRPADQPGERPRPGDISFGLYLWHFPLVVLAPIFLSLTGWASVAVVLAGTLCSPSSRTTSSSGPRSMPHGCAHGPCSAFRILRPSSMLVVGVGAAASARPDLFSGSSVAASAPEAEGAVPPPAGEVVTPAASAHRGQSECVHQQSDQALPAPRAAPRHRPPRSRPPPRPLRAWTPIPLGATGTRVQDGLRRALASSSWPAEPQPVTRRVADHRRPAQGDERLHGDRRGRPGLVHLRQPQRAARSSSSATRSASRCSRPSRRPTARTSRCAA